MISFIWRGWGYLGGVTANGYKFLLGVTKIRLCSWLHNSVNILKTLHCTLNKAVNKQKTFAWQGHP